MPEPSLRLIRVGEPVTITLVAFPDEIFPGRSRGSPTCSIRRPARSRCTWSCPTRGPSPPRDVRHRPARRGPDAVPVLPAGAIVQEYGRPVVFVERAPGQYERREVTVGHAAATACASCGACSRATAWSSTARCSSRTGDGAVRPPPSPSRGRPTRPVRARPAARRRRGGTGAGGRPGCGRSSSSRSRPIRI